MRTVRFVLDASACHPARYLQGKLMPKCLAFIFLVLLNLISCTSEGVNQCPHLINGPFFDARVFLLGNHICLSQSVTLLTSSFTYNVKWLPLGPPLWSRQASQVWRERKVASFFWDRQVKKIAY